MNAAVPEPIADEAATAELAPRVLPPGWIPGTDVGWATNGYVQPRQKLAVLVSVEHCPDGKRWLHVSVPHKSRIPTWDELRWVKELFVGRDRKAIQVLPPESEYINHHSNVLHLWCCLDADPLPDFRRQGTI